MASVAFIALEYTDGTVARMQFRTIIPPRQISPDAAIAAGFVFNAEMKQWERDPTPELVTRELRHSQPVTRWRVMPEGDAFETMDHRWGPAWRVNGDTVAVDLVEARKVRAKELEREKTSLIETTAKDHMIATAKGDNAAAAIARKKVQDLAALDKAAIEASVAAVADLDALAKHEPQPIKDAKPTKPVKADEVDEGAVSPR